MIRVRIVTPLQQIMPCVSQHYILSWTSTAANHIYVWQLSHNLKISHSSWWSDQLIFYWHQVDGMINWSLVFHPLVGTGSDWLDLWKPLKIKKCAINIYFQRNTFFIFLAFSFLTLMSWCFWKYCKDDALNNMLTPYLSKPIFLGKRTHVLLADAITLLLLLFKNNGNGLLQNPEKLCIYWLEFFGEMVVESGASLQKKVAALIENVESFFTKMHLTNHVNRKW